MGTSTIASASATAGVATCRMLSLAFVMSVALCVCAKAQSARPNTDPTNGEAAPLKNEWVNRNFKHTPSDATAEIADPGRALSYSAISADTLAGHGPGCSPLSPCAAVSPARSGSTPMRRAAPRIAFKTAGSGIPTIGTTKIDRLSAACRRSSHDMGKALQRGRTALHCQKLRV